MGIADVLESTREAITAKRVFVEPYVHDVVTILPAAKIGGGAGSGESEAEGREGGGSGMGLGGVPAGAFVIENGHATWRPAIDVNRVILGGQIVAIVALLTIRSIAKARSKAQGGSCCQQ